MKEDGIHICLGRKLHQRGVRNEKINPGIWIYLVLSHFKLVSVKIIKTQLDSPSP
jgi:hypothetical protein